MEVQPVDAHFVAMVSYLDRAIILKLDELVVEGNFRDVYFASFTMVIRLPQRAPEIVNSPSAARSDASRFFFR